MTENETKQCLESKITFSWGNVFSGWIQNLKDDIDPALKGAKMGVFGLHAIPTWMRQYDEGKMSSDKPFLSGLLGLVVGGSSIVGYVAAGEYINRSTNSDWGYSMIGVPVAAQGVSWIYEAFLRAKKTELSKVVMTRLQRTLDVKSEGGYDIANEQLVETVANKLYNLWETEAQERISNYKIGIEEAKSSADMADLSRQQRITHCETEITILEQDRLKFKTSSLKYARKGIFYTARNVFNGLVADGQLGKTYKMSLLLETGPTKRQRDKDAENCCIDEYCSEDETEGKYRLIQQSVVELIGDVVKETIKSKNGSAKIELFGTMNSVYTNDGKDMHYEVIPNANIWKV